MFRRLILAFLAPAAALVLLLGGLALAPSAQAAEYRFSLDSSSPTLGAGDAATVYEPVSSVATVVTTSASLGLAVSDELDAMTSGGASTQLVYGLARGAANGAETRLWVTSIASIPSATIANAEMGLQSIALEDNIDALDLLAQMPSHFSLASGHAYIGTASAAGCGGDLFSAGPSFATSYTALGLASCSDDVDALHIDSVSGDIFYSLAPGSPSLAPGSGIGGCTAGCSAADIFVVVGGGGSAVVHATAAQLGRTASADIDALAAAGHCSSAVGSDGDGDGIDDGCDNCIFLANPDQFDTELDGVGVLYDADYSHDGIVGGQDFSELIVYFGTQYATTPLLFRPRLDSNQDGVVGGPDFSRYLTLYQTSSSTMGLGCFTTTKSPCVNE